MRVIKIVAIVLVVVALAFLGLYLYSRSHVLDKDGMVAPPDKLLKYEYTESGDMNGAEKCYKLERTEDGQAKLSVYRTEYYNAEPEQYTKILPGETLDSIAEVFQKYGMDTWTDCPRSEIVALDAAVGHWAFQFERGYYAFNDNQELPDSAREAMAEIGKLLQLP